MIPVEDKYNYDFSSLLRRTWNNLVCRQKTTDNNKDGNTRATYMNRLTGEVKWRAEFRLVLG